ncbi:MAG: hypothetical protein KDA24_10675 [Deltaproteobacteria bacterium]|nr:hypothetical protein [Deltaproteobacteria bacterium]
MRRTVLTLTCIMFTGCLPGEELVCDSEDGTMRRAAGRDVLVRSPIDEELTPRGTVLLFHGLGESACTWVDRVEGRRLSDRFRDLGFTVLAPDSGPNTSAWRTGWPGNDDAAGIDATLRDLADASVLDLDLPALALGHSNGGTFAPIWAEESSTVSVLAAVDANGWGSDALGGAASPPPVLFISARNDVIVPQSLTRAAEQKARDAGHEVESLENEPQAVRWNRFARIPTVDEDSSRAFFDALEAGDFLDSDGTLRANPRLDRRWVDVVPDELSEHVDALEEQLHVLFAEHRFSSDNREAIVSFFDAALED